MHPAGSPRLAVVLLALAALTCRRGGKPPATETRQHGVAELADGFQESAVFTNLDHPTALRFAPDGRVFVAEKGGRILVFPSVSDPTPTEFARLDQNVHAFWDRGLLGLAVHPQFPTQPYVYALYALDAPVGGTPPVWNDDCPKVPGATDDGCVIGARLVRLEASNGGNVSTGRETVLLEGWGQQYPSHSIGGLGFGPDGALYVSGGDGASFGFVDYGQKGMPKNPLGDPPVPVGGDQVPPFAAGGALRSQSLRRLSGGATLSGAILRLDPMTGEALPDNPLAGRDDPIARRIVAYGLRNPLRFTFRPGTSEIWIGDVGQNIWEEINRVVNPLDPAVRNFGWPCYEGKGRQGGYDGANLLLCELLYLEGSATPPHFTYDHGAKVVPGEDCPVGNSSTTALAFYTGDKYPPKYRNALFFGDFARQCAWVMLPGPDGVPDPSRIESFGVELDHIVDLQMGPDGNLYYVNHYDGEIRRITYLSPQAVATGTPLAGPAPLVVEFDGSASKKPLPDDTLTFAWDLDGDGAFDDASEEKPSTVYGSDGTYRVRLQITDQRGASAVSDPVVVTVSASAMTSQPPVPVIDTPAAALRWKVGDTISFSGHATDPEDGALPASAFTWMLVARHCPGGCHSHVVRSWTGITEGSFTAPDHEYPVHIELVLTVTDGSGIRRSTTRRLDPETRFLTLRTQPPGLTLTLGVDDAVAPFGRELVRGGFTTVAAAPLQTLGTRTFVFQHWSSGLPPTHEVGPMEAHASHTATYRLAGLTGEYFTDETLTERKLLRIDGVVDFDWSRSPPDPAVPIDFGARWTGKVVPPASEAFTFAIDADDGARLWLDDVLVIDSWNEPGNERAESAPLPLVAGRAVRVRLEYYDDRLDAQARLLWSSPSVPQEIVPADRLYPGCAGGACPDGLTCVEGDCVAQCPGSCPAGQRCDGGRCVDPCADLACGAGKCLAGACVPRCHDVTCAAGLTCEPATGRCEDLACRSITCPESQVCTQGVCKAACLVNGCSDVTRCNATTGACEPKCAGVTCAVGFTCAPRTGACEDVCRTLACPGQACHEGACKPTCVVMGCPPTADCNASSGACEPKCAAITCAPGAACVPETGQCEGVVEPGSDAGAPHGADAGEIEAGGRPESGDAALVDVPGDVPVVARGEGGGCGCRVGRMDRGRGAAPLLLVLAVISLRRSTTRRSNARTVGRSG